MLAPRSVAVLGASADLGKINGRPLRFLLEKGYRGAIYPVNPKYEQIAGLRCYPSVSAIGQPVDMAVVAVPAKFVAASIEELARCKVPAAVVFSSGFGEMGEEGRRLEREVLDIARRGGVRICGPNCLGLINAFDGVVATFSQYADGETAPGPVGFVTQSGAFGTAIAALARRRGLRLGYFVNTGNESDVAFAEVMQAVLADDRIRVGAGYSEGIKQGGDLVRLALDAMERGKPLVLTKVGRTSAGARAAASHTGSLAGEDAVFAGIARQHGIVRARNEEHMLDLVEAFAYCALPAGPGLGIVTQSGGAAVLMADRAEEVGLNVPALSAQTQERMREVIPGFGIAGNPVDITGQFVAEPELLAKSTEILLSDPAIDVGIVWIQLMDAHVDKLVAIFRRIKANVTKPFVVCWVAASERAVTALHDLGIAVLRGAEPAVDAVAGLVEYARARAAWQEGRDTAAASGPALPALPARPGPVDTLTAAALLDACGVPLVPARLATSAAEAARTAQALGFPVALKIESPDILHKTEAGGVRLGLADAQAVAAAYEEVIASARRHAPAASIDGAVLQPMAQRGLELVVGLRKDPVFGPVVMVGLGGIFVEVLRDVSFRRAPVSEGEALRMLDELRGRAMLDGVRGQAAADRAAIARLVAAVSRFGALAGERLDELDLNPVMVAGDRAVAVDWLLILA